MSRGERWQALTELMARLRGPKGCPWDKEQTLESLRPYILEEAYELVDAIEQEDTEAIREEAGDLLLEVLFVSQICAEQERFRPDDVLESLASKLVRRHPHVFGEKEAENAGEALARWEEIKDSEKESAGESLLAKIPRALPALIRASKLSTQAARVGFDWASVEQILDKLREELAELESARRSGDRQEVVEELGDLLFVLANLARHLGVDPELALRSANRKFEERFQHIEQRLADDGRSPAGASLDEMERLWQEAKRRGKGPKLPPS
ncbi:MAG TPA: nucleoside triphosphate pyrophosphohydrolase [Vicinamibacteria bacterium]